MSIMHFRINCKNGPGGYVIHTWAVDLDKPKVQVVGLQYEFRDKLLDSEYFREPRERNG